MWGRGCVMACVIAAGPALAMQLTDAPIDMPSGQSVSLAEVLLDDTPGTLWVRFRFLAPDIARDGGDIPADVAAMDMQQVCDDVIAPYLVAEEIAPERIVVSFSDRPVPFGQSDAEATQFFELFSLRDGACIWEEF